MRGIVSGAIIALFCVTARFGTSQTGSQKVLDNGTQVVNAKVYGAVCDGGSHPLSGYYAFAGGCTGRLPIYHIADTDDRLCSR